ncbi:nuclease homologue [Halopseudomonas xinjiangensis]|uniref:Nuclease homologue n=1 Tax=Halopseudomonas xinjiangensis TaxID=487184 RepID=A0A1H1WWG7_9GAMM|nr:thermonuclease family protein [Halopseudomonas xinjiangensis]SDT01568.1 nuclease homologue [Halopseudomonas xinjiangensis]
MAGFETRKALQWSAFFVVWLFTGLAQADACRMPEDDAVRVHSRTVFDGDTLELTDGRRVRLIGINAPEIGREGKASEPFARAAEQRLQQLTRGKPLYLVPGEEPRDRYGRTLGHLFDAGGTNLEAQLLAEGLGFAIGVPPNLDMVQCHAAAEKAARTTGRGLWSGHPVIEASRLERGGFQIVRGTVRSAEKAGRFWWLALDGQVVLRIPQDDRNVLAGRDPSAMQGELVEARGWVIDRRGQRSVNRGHQRFMLPVRHDSMLRNVE